MPEPDVELDLSSMVVEWGTVRLAGPGQLRLTMALQLEAGRDYVARYATVAAVGAPVSRSTGAETPFESARARPCLGVAR
jgi:hypothetical protein